MASTCCRSRSLRKCSHTGFGKPSTRHQNVVGIPSLPGGQKRMIALHENDPPFDVIE
ncbi:protein of unknown function (plasmid) [Rhodovastum atsumiense]|nr:protein of unknown function [Rhodovastum atsumiense]